MVSLTFCALQFSFMVFPVGLLRVSFLTLVDGFRGGSLVNLRISYLPLIDVYRNGLRAAMLVE
jgi:hypothetical protein